MAVFKFDVAASLWENTKFILLPTSLYIGPPIVHDLLLTVTRESLVWKTLISLANPSKRKRKRKKKNSRGKF